MSDTDIAFRIIDSGLNKVKAEAYRLVYAVDILKPEPFKESSCYMIGTDGEHLFFDPEKVAGSYTFNGMAVIEEEIFHVIMHGILGHFGMSGEYGRVKLAGCVMDLQIEQIMEALGMNRTYRCLSRPDWYSTVGFGLYNLALQDRRMAEKVLRTGAKRRIDDHSLWWGKGSVRKEVVTKWEQAARYITGSDSKHLKDAAYIAGILRSDSPGSILKKSFRPEGRRQSLADALSGFLRSRTVSREQPDYIDPMLYEYGLSLYGDIPLIEPPEEYEMKSMENLVIAIDTSGSCLEHTERFLDQLLEIFEEEAPKFCFKTIYVLQCDDRLQKVEAFNSMEDLKPFGEDMEFCGYGGTDFRPVFQWIDDSLVSEGEQVDLLLYFSDAWGSFPDEKSAYPVMFVLPESEIAVRSDIPDWIDTVILKERKEKEEMTDVQYQ